MEEKEEKAQERATKLFSNRDRLQAFLFFNTDNQHLNSSLLPFPIPRARVHSLQYGADVPKQGSKLGGQTGPGP